MNCHSKFFVIILLTTIAYVIGIPINIFATICTKWVLLIHIFIPSIFNQQLFCLSVILGYPVV